MSLNVCKYKAEHLLQTICNKGQIDDHEGWDVEEKYREEEVDYLEDHDVKPGC